MPPLPYSAYPCEMEEISQFTPLNCEELFNQGAGHNQLACFCINSTSAFVLSGMLVARNPKLVTTRSKSLSSVCSPLATEPKMPK